MEAPPTPAESFACPRCAAALAASEGGFSCASCGSRYPRFGGIPCLVEDPALWRTLWLRRLEAYGGSVEIRVNALREEAEAPGLLPRTQRRLLRIADGLVAQVEALGTLFEPLEVASDSLASLAIPNRPDPSQQVALLESYDPLFRDWAWGQGEHDQVVGLVEPLLSPALGRVVVAGSGAARLVLDLHHRRALRETFALDLNPLPLLVAARLFAKETVQLPEFPADPRSDEVVVVDRTLTAPLEARPGLGLVFGDALQPPFSAGSIDAVVTSWFIDAARADLRAVAAAVNRMLRPGGVWVNLGPLRFQAVLARAYTIEEVVEIVATSGFEVAPQVASSENRHDLPYGHSPASGSRRTDTVFRFAARKTAEAGKVDVPEPFAPWIGNPLLPIPITPALIALGKSSMFTTGILSMIDGERSIVEVARELGASWGVDPARIQDELRAFLAQVSST